ncbi:unnamed protein product [Victoria cruziana]
MAVLLLGTRMAVGFAALFWQMQLIMAGCPLDLSGSNFPEAASACSKQDRGNCCRYMHAFVAIAVARYANITGRLGVPSDMVDVCLTSVSETLELYGIPSNATKYCHLGVKIPVDFRCDGRITVLEMLLVPKFEDVIRNCNISLSKEESCRSCLNAIIPYLHNLVGFEGSAILSTCRDATFATLISQSGNISSFDIASCFFGVRKVGIQPVSGPSPKLLTPQPSSSSPVTSPIPNQQSVHSPSKEERHPYHLTLVPRIGIAVMGMAFLLLIILILLIHRKARELKDSPSTDTGSWKDFNRHWKIPKRQEGSSPVFRRFSYKEMKKATSNFSTVIGKGGFGTVYKAEFDNGFTAAVKRMNKVSEQGEDEFCREMELLGRLHHRHLVALRGFCVEQNERFLIYEYMQNGSLKDHLHTPGKAPLNWKMRVQIAIDVANALEYLHFYCDPPLCHRDIKSSNILLDESFVAKVADFGLAHAARIGAVSFEPVNTDIRGTPGYMDPEYVVTQELTEKSDIYSYGVLLLELITARKAIQESRNLVEWSRKFMTTTSSLPEMVDPVIADAYDFEQLHTMVRVVRWCTQREGRCRPSIKQVLRLLQESSDPVRSTLPLVAEDEDGGGEGTKNRGKFHRNSDAISPNGDARYLQSSSSTSRSYCSRSFLLDTGSPPSPNGLSV